MIVFQQLSGHDRGRRAGFDEGPILIGRSPDAQLRFDPHVDIDVSARHAVVIREGDAWVIRDVGSRNGTFVGGKRVREQILRDRDEIELGHGGPRLHVSVESASSLPMEHADTEPGAAQASATSARDEPQPDAVTQAVAFEAETVAISAPPDLGRAAGGEETRPESPAAKKKASRPSAGRADAEVAKLRAELRRTRAALFVVSAFAIASVAFVLFGR